MKWSSAIVGVILVGLGGLAWMNQRGPKVGGLPDGDLSDPTRDLPQWQVVRVVDGDTIKVRRNDENQNGEEMTLRLCGIDAPEKSQELGPEATAMMQWLVDSSGGWVLMDAIETDRYGQTVAEVWSPQVGLFNASMLVRGMTFVYERYVEGCPNWRAMVISEEIVKEEKVGVWRRSDSVKPWEWRSSNR